MRLLTLFHDPGFAAPLGTHIMPIRKFAMVADEVRAGFPGIRVASPQPLTVADLERVHTTDYIEAVRTGEPRELAESQKFPWSPLLFPSVLLTGGGVLAAADEALRGGTSGALASGFHHARAACGEGFCTFNGLVVALEALRAAGRIRTAAVLDMDLHYGNGTAELAGDRPWLRALSIYGNDYAGNVAYRDVTIRRHTDGPNHHSVALVPTGGDDREMLFETMAGALPWLVAGGRPDILLYQAGADPLRDDPYSPLNLDHEALFERDLRVFRFASEHGIPVAWVLAGGYTKDVSQVVAVHVNTVRAWQSTFAASCA